ENTILQSEANLRKLLGVSLEAREPPLFEPVKVNRTQNADTLLSASAPDIHSFFDYQITKIQEEINGSNVSLAKRKYYPQVSLNSGASYINQNYLNSNTVFSAGHQLSWNTLLTVQYNLWDWGSRKRDVEIAEYNRDVQENGLNQNLLT